MYCHLHSDCVVLWGKNIHFSHLPFFFPPSYSDDYWEYFGDFLAVRTKTAPSDRDSICRTVLANLIRSNFNEASFRVFTYN